MFGYRFFYAIWNLRYLVLPVLTFLLVEGTFNNASSDSSLDDEDRATQLETYTNTYHKLCQNGSDLDICPRLKKKVLKGVDDLCGISSQRQGKCLAATPLVSFPHTNLPNQIAEIGNKATHEDCPQTEPTQSCMSQILCNVGRSALTFFGGLQNSSFSRQIADKLSKTPQMNQCLKSTQSSNCLTELLHGILQTLWFPVGGITSMIRWGIGRASEENIQKQTYEIDAKSRASMTMASEQQPSKIQLFLKDPAAFIQEHLNHLTKTFADFTQQSFGCTKWSGTPHLSSCTKPSSDWKCSDCDTRFNMMCGLSGVAGAGAATLPKMGTMTVLFSAIKLGDIVHKNMPDTSSKHRESFCSKMQNLLSP